MGDVFSVSHFAGPPAIAKLPRGVGPFAVLIGKERNLFISVFQRPIVALVVALRREGAH